MRAKKRKVIRSKVKDSGSPYEMVKGYGARQHQDVVPEKGQGPYGNCAAIVPWGDTPPVEPPPVGHGKGFKGW